jgi:hypothetical protein
MRRGSIKLEEYYVNRPIQDDIVALSSKSLSCEYDRKKVNELILNFIIKYLAEYLEILETNILKVRQQINETIQMAYTASKTPDSYIANVYAEMCNGHQGSDFYPLMCVADLRATAAIVKEIIFNDRFESEGRFVGLDFGSGTGILTAAMVIAAKRRQIDKILCVGVEMNSIAAMKSRRVLEKLFGEEQVAIAWGDITKPEMFDKMPQNTKILSEAGWTKKDPIQYWISETFSTGTPPLDTNLYRHNMSAAEIMFDEWKMDEQENVDPFPHIYWNSRNNLKLLKKNVKRGKTAMFPDPINGHFKPNMKRSALRLMTGLEPHRRLMLKNIGSEFYEYEDLKNGYQRWKTGNDQIPLF